MDTIIMQPADLTGASYSFAFFAMAAAAVLLLLGTGWVARSWKLPVALCAIACGIGAVALFEARAAWLVSGGVPLVYHYVGWAVSTPVQVIALYFFARVNGPVAPALFWRLGVVSVLMVLVRYAGDAGFMHPTLAFLIGIIFWLYILGELYFGQMDEIIRKAANQAVQRGYFWLRLIITVGWAIYPLGYFITSFGGYVDHGGLSVTYNVADFLNRIAFGLTVLSAAVLASEGETND